MSLRVCDQLVRKRIDSSKSALVKTSREGSELFASRICVEMRAIYDCSHGVVSVAVTGCMIESAH